MHRMILMIQGCAGGVASWLIAVIAVAVVVSWIGDQAEANPDPPANAVAADAMGWWSVDGGGGEAAGGGWTLVATVGQPDAGRLTGGSTILDGGFVLQPAPQESPLFEDGFETGDTGAWSSTTGGSS